MDVSALDSPFRADASSSNQPRRFGDASGERFARLLDRPEHRPSRHDKPERAAKAERPERPDHSERQERAVKNQRLERPERPDRAERPDSAERADRAERPDGPERPDRTERADRPEAAERPSPAAHSDKRTAPKADTQISNDIAPADIPPIDRAPIDATPIEETVEIAVAATAIDAAPAAAPDVQTAESAAATSSDLVKMSALALAHHVGLLLAQTQSGAGAGAAAPDEVAAGPAKAERAAAQPPLPVQGGAQVADDAATAESFADFVLRTAANPAALAAAADDADAGAKTDAKAEGTKAEIKGQLLVSVSQPLAVAAPVAPVAAIAVQAGAQKTATDLAVGAETANATKDDPLKPTAKPSENAPLFAQSLERAQNAQAAAPAAEAKSRPVFVPPHEQVALHVKKAVAEGQDRIVIRLNPVDLGRIEIKLDVGQDGTLRASFAAERAQTLEALKNDSRQLERALQEAGLKPDAGGLNFSLRGDNRENAQAFADLGRESRGRRDGGAEDDPALPRDAGAPAAPAAYRGARRSPGGLDLAV